MADAVAGSRALVIWLGTVGRPVVARAAPTWAGVMIVAGVILGGNGLSPRDAVALASSSVRAVAVLSAAWLLLTSAAVRVAFGAPGASYLRTLPGGPGLERTTVIVAAAAVHAPWAALWFAGGGVVHGVVAWAGMTVVSLALVMVSGRLVRAPSVPQWRGAIRAIAGVHLRSLTRRRMSSLVAGAGLAALGGAFAALVIGHEAREPRDAMVIAGAVSAIALAASMAAAATAIAVSDQQLGWMASASAITPAARRSGTTMILAALGVGAGLVATAAAAAVTPLGAKMLGAVAGTNALVGLGIGLAATEVGARAVRRERVDGARVVIGLLLVGVTGLLVIGQFHEIGVFVFVAMGAGAAAGGGRR